MAMFEAEGEKQEESIQCKKKFELQYKADDRVSGGAPIPRQANTAIQSGIFTVAYFLPDGDVIIRYEQKPGENRFLALQSFAIIKCHPSVNGAAPSIEFLKKPDVIPVKLKETEK